jgi:hypothetical protein
MDCVKVFRQIVSLILGCENNLPITFVVMLSLFLKHVMWIVMLHNISRGPGMKKYAKNIVLRNLISKTIFFQC